MTPGPVVILVPVLRRPHRVRPLLDSVERATPQPHRVVFIPDPDDVTEIVELEAQQAEFMSVAGNYSVKINAGIRATDEPLIFIGADDLDFKPGWLEAAAALLDDRIAVVGTQDLCNPRVIAGQHATHFLVARWYVEECGTIDEPGKLLHEGYPHEYTDDELIGTARKRGAWAFAADSVVEHLHPLAGKAPNEGLYLDARRRLAQGRPIYNRRRHLWA